MILTVLISIFCLAFSIWSFTDSRDLDRKKESKPLGSFLKNTDILFGFFAFLLAEIAWQLVFLFQDQIMPRGLESIYMIIFAVGFFLGIVFQIRYKFTDKRGILIGLLFSILPLLIAASSDYFNMGDSWIQPVLGYGVFTFGSGVYLPCVFSFYSKWHALHEQGKILGLLDAVQTLAEIIASVILFILRAGFGVEEIGSGFSLSTMYS